METIITEALRKSEVNFFKLIDDSPDALVIHQRQRILYANPYALALFGYTSVSEVAGRSLFDFVPQAYRAIVADRVFQTYFRGATTAEVELRFLHRSGTEIPVEVVSIPFLLKDESATLSHIRDIRARKTLELQLRTEDRLASIGLMAAGIAHEINNPLTYALCNADLLGAAIDELPPSVATSELREMLGHIKDGLDRAAHVTREVTLFARREDDTTAFVDLHRVLDSCIDLARIELRSRARLVKHYGAVPPVRGSARRLGQVFLNLLINAAQAIPPGNEVLNEVSVTTSTHGSDSVVVLVRDTGTGIAPEHLAHVFEPLFTTKSQGTGLGLAIARTLVAESGGAMSFESEVGHGTVFRVVLRASSTAEAESPVLTRERAHSAGKRILIVDDEPKLARVLERVLQRHATTVAASGREALDRFRAGASYDLILCDLSMAELDGVAFYEQLRAGWPGMEKRVVFMSGDTFSPRASAFFRSVPNQVIEKPFQGQALVDVVDSVLESLPPLP